MEQLIHDVRYALRTMAKSPGFTVVAALALALGIGANTAIFSVVNALLLKPLPYAESDRIVAVWNYWTDWPRVWLSEPELFDYQRQSEVFERVGAYQRQGFNLTGGDAPARVLGGTVSADLFTVLGAKPVLGRTFTTQEDRPKANHVVVLGDGLWHRRFNADPGIIGRAIALDGEQYEVIGVMPHGFQLPTDFKEPDRTELWVPLAIDPASASRGSHYLLAVARLKPGVSLEQARAGMNLVTGNLIHQYPLNYQNDFGATLTPMRDEIFGDVRPILIVLIGAVGFVLLIACANVANLLLARGEARQKEVALRAAIGASRARLIRQLLTESVLLSLVGGGGGVLLAVWLTDALVRVNPTRLPRIGEVAVDGRVLLFTLGLAVVTGLVFGLVPALQGSRSDLHESLKEGGRDSSAGARGSRVRRALVVSEVALALILLIGAGLMIKSFWRLQTVPSGFNADNVLTLRTSLPQTPYSDMPRVAAFYRRFFERVASLPGVISAGGVTNLPLTSPLGDWDILLAGQAPDPKRRSDAADYQIVTPDYFKAIGMPLRRGRFFSDADRPGAIPVVLINEAMAAAYWPNQDPLGKRFTLGGNKEMSTIVGIVADVKHRGLDKEAHKEMYFPLEQFPYVSSASSLTTVIRTAGDPLAVVGEIRNEIRQIDPDLPVSQVRTMNQVVANSVSDREMSLVLLSLFAGVALLLAGVGIYGVMAFTVSRRTHEIGVRMALGATAPDVLKLVIAQGMKLALAGLSIGVVGAVVLTRLMSSMLFGVSATDPPTFIVLAVFIAGVAFLANYVPARRATRVDPLTALRHE